MDISARTEYAVRAMLILADHSADNSEPLGIETLAAAQDLPKPFLQTILSTLRTAGLVRSLRGPRGGYSLGRQADAITLGEIFRAVSGPLAEVRGLRPNETSYEGVAQHLPSVWVALRAAMRDVLDTTTIADVLAGELPANVDALAAQPDAWQVR